MRKNREIWSTAEKVLLGLIDPFDVEIEGEINKLSDIRKQTRDEDELHRGIKSYKYINEINSKQGEKINQVLTEKIDLNWGSKNKQLQDFLHNKPKIKDLESKITIEINNARFAFPLERKTQLPKTLDRNFVFTNKDKILEIYKHLELSDFIPKEGIIIHDGSSRDQLVREDFDVNDELFEFISEISKKIKRENQILILKYILHDSYSETFMRLQALGYLVSNGAISLVPADNEEIQESGQYKVINKPWTENEASKEKENVQNIGSSFILGISYSDWKEMESFVGQDNFEGRPILANLG